MRRDEETGKLLFLARFPGSTLQRMPELEFCREAFVEHSLETDPHQVSALE